MKTQNKWHEKKETLRDKRDLRDGSNISVDSDFPYVSLVPYVPCVPITLSPFVTLVTLPPPPVIV